MGIEDEGPTCVARPDMANLKSFPFKSTKCDIFNGDGNHAKSGEKMDWVIDYLQGKSIESIARTYNRSQRQISQTLKSTNITIHRDREKR